MNLMWYYAKKYKKYIYLNFICVFSFILIELGLPTLLAKIIDEGLVPRDFEVVKSVALWMFVICFVGLVGLIVLAYCVSRISTSVIRDIRDDIFEKIQEFSHEEYDKFGISYLVTSTTNDAFQVMTFLQMILRIGMIAPLMFVSSFVMIIYKSPSLSLSVLIAVPFLLIGVLWIGKRSEPLSEKQQKGLDDINTNLRESLTGLRVIRAFVNEKFQEERFEQVNRSYAEISKKLFKLMAFALPGFSFIFNIILAFVIWFGSKQINTGTLQVGELVAFIEYIFHALFSFMLFATVFMMYPRAAVSAHRIERILQTKPTISENEGGVVESETHGYITFENVTFAYPGNTDEPIIRDINFTAKPGETVAFIGSTGSGKSTLIQLIPRFYDVTKGKILIDGIDVRDYRLSALRDKIGFIPQKALLFSGTIAENIRYGKHDATENEVGEASEVAQAIDFINLKTNQFEEYLSEGGNNMSGGQKQRLSIARAVVKKPDIYIFDDSFSALDYQTDAKLRARLKEVTTDSTVLIVAQRVGTIMDADKILVLNEGVVVAEGTHKELLKTSDIYYDIASSQLSEEELS
ncbi:MAG: ABC transporter ATP-binding protein [Sebaldella sp.]|nr:ABC transporter ATP-binding protein [Sebaldella sp.]